MADGAFAIGAGDMNRLPREIDTLEEGSNALQTGLNPGH